MNYKEAKELLDAGRTESLRNRRKLANNTYLERISETEIGVKLHSTFVIRFFPRRTVLNTGGWFTVTTKARINDYSPGKVYSNKGEWFYYPPNSGERYNGFQWDNGFPFFDGIAVSPDGTKVLNPLPVSESEAREAERKKLKRDIGKFVTLAMEKLAAGMPAQDSGDCFYCQMRTVENGTALGDATDNHEHLLSHIAEGYVPSSLLVNAVTEKGYPIPAIILGYDPETETIGSGYLFADGVKRALRSYLSKRLVKGAASN